MILKMPADSLGLRATAWLTVAWLWSASCWGQHVEPFRVITREEGVDCQAARNVFRQVDAVLDRVHRDVPGQTPECVVVLSRLELRDGMEIVELAGGKLQVYLPETVADWSHDRAHLNRLLGALLLHRLEQPVVAGHKRVPPWLTSGLLHWLETRLDGSRLPGFVNYPGLRGMLESGAELSLSALLEVPLSPGKSATYLLQMESGAALLQGLLRLPSGRQALTAMIVSVTTEKAFPERALAEHFDPLIMPLFGNDAPGEAALDPAQRRQHWFWEAIRMAAVNPFHPASAQFAELRFRNLETLTYRLAATTGERASPGPDKDGDWRACRLEEFGDRWAEMAQPERVLARQQKATTELHFMVSDLLRPPVDDMIAAYRRLGTGDRHGFARTITAARRDFHERLARLAAIERRLREIEEAILPPGWRYAEALAALAAAKERHRELWPELHELLDREEAVLAGKAP